ncbi:hypothetical protein KKC63_01155 [Patescibacteria group bacterium]|nr:hypothetical protein [Patescibacteria group bacterium]MBU4023084.1 hypothetical protein [Patescibacteria group bacterium]
MIEVKRKTLFVLLVIGALFCLPSYGQGRIGLYTDEGPIPLPIYIRTVSEGELAELLRCDYFPKASCENCGVRFYKSETLRIVSKENFEELRSWFYNAMKYDMAGFEDHEALRMFEAVLALSPWRELAFGIAYRASKASLPYIYGVLIVEEEYGRLVAYRMTAGGVFNKMSSDSQVRLVIFP